MLLSGEGRPGVTGMADPPEGSSSSAHTYPATRSRPAAWLLSGDTKEQRGSRESIWDHSLIRLLIEQIFFSHHFVITIRRLVKNFYSYDENSPVDDQKNKIKYDTLRYLKHLKNR